MSMPFFSNLFIKQKTEFKSFRSEEIHSPTAQYGNDPTDFLLADIHSSNPCTPLSPMTSPLTGTISPNQYNKRKRHDDDDEIEDLLNSLLDLIHHDIILTSNQTFKRQKI